MSARDEVAKIIVLAVRDRYSQEPEVEVSYPESRFGDFTTNIAHKLASQLEKTPLEVATELSGAIKHKEIAEVAVSGGFINLTMADSFWSRQIDGISKDYLKSADGQGRKVQVEFISANPTGPLTLGNARGGFIGDVLANVLEASGFEVTREYYFNDAGTQISKLLESVKVEAGLAEVEERQYGGAYIKKLAHDFKTDLSKLGDKELKQKLTKAIFEDYIKPDIEKMNIEFDTWFNETSLLEDGTLQETVKLLKDRGLLFERDGAQWLRTGKGGDPREERVFIKSSGDPTYLAPDVAYHVNIFAKRKFDMAIKELGPDHIAQFPSLQATVKLLFPDKVLRMVGHQQLRLTKAGKEVKMSKRLGQFVTVGELIDEVGPDVARFFILMRSADTHMDFDLNLAKEESQKNPFYYVMYAYVRAKSILSQAKKQKLAPGGKIGTLSASERALARQLLRLQELAAEISSSYEVNKLTNWGTELAKLFHEYYEAVKIIDLPPVEAQQKLYFLLKLTEAMEAYWQLLGITPRTKM